MNVICIDLELNQPSRKIIELGYVIANVKTQKIIKKESIYVNPNEKLSPMIIELTGITQEQVDYGVSLTEAYNIMCQHISKYEVNKHAIQWGTDHFELRNDLDIEWNDYIFRRRAHDIKSLYQIYAMSQSNGSTVAGLGNAMKKLGLEFIGKQHCAADDAYNTLIVMFELQNKFKSYDQIKKILK